nr:hypothetical protein [candidate division Zixibacteria bacterium]
MEEEQTDSNTSNATGKNTTKLDDSEKITIVDIIDVIADRVDPLLQLLKAFFEQSIRRERAVARLQLRMAWIALVVVFLIVGVSGALTYLDKIDGATFTFLLGLVVGYVLTFIRDTISPREE